MPQDQRPASAHPVLAWLRREALPLAAMLLLLGAARDTLANHYQVPSGSMQPTLQPGDHVAVDMRAYGLRLPFTGIRLLDTGHPQRGDVAVFDSPADGTRLIKRVVAVAGDRVELHGGYLRINGRPLRLEPRQEAFGGKQVTLDLDAGGGPDIDGITVPEGKLLVLGDHRGDSFDGRFFGLVDADTVYGKARAVFWRRGEGMAWRAL
ncbi:signal peptidase I [Stenotrophomonas sp. MYb238]|uniref:signal peptidase I n=1 Tax=Stenotrophomonas sp. MYb238 TaxID=2040281 RepID=UPI001292278A|nr:signal peptidase I [Stenotrophomonas sp. MYb238]MQP76556.1 signal peptidase I [Stenotrophomonas sp. MYb238]